MVNFGGKLRKILLILFLSFLTPDGEAMEFRVADKADYKVSVAQTPAQLEQGLMFVRQMDDDVGMLFDLREEFENGLEVTMWMKNTYIPLDMLFLDCNKTIVDIYENAEPLSLRLIKSRVPCCYVVEVNGGQASKHHFAVGDKTFFNL
jgi:uncharacterized membrane protein (UPF0127 family)